MVSNTVFRSNKTSYYTCEHKGMLNPRAYVLFHNKLFVVSVVVDSGCFDLPVVLPCQNKQAVQPHTCRICRL